MFLSSHSYLILKELEVNKREGDTLRYFAFDETEKGTVVRPAEFQLPRFEAKSRSRPSMQICTTGKLQARNRRDR